MRVTDEINQNATADEVFDWWLSDENPDVHFGMLRNQTKMNFNDPDKTKTPSGGASE